MEARRRAEKEQQAQSAARTAKARHKAAARERDTLAQEEAARLDALWEQLEKPSRRRIEELARQRLGVLGHAGRAPAALVAMRRTLQRGCSKPRSPAKAHNQALQRKFKEAPHFRSRNPQEL